MPSHQDGVPGPPANDVDVELLEGLPTLATEIVRALIPAKRGGPDGTLPDHRVMVTGLDQDAERFTAYSRVCGFTLRDTVPATWLHVLTFPLQVRLMASGDFPLGLAGLVHVANSMQLHRSVDIGEQLSLSSSAVDLRAHRAGTQVDLLGEARVGDEVVWTGRSTYLARGQRPSGSEAPSEAPRPEVEPVTPSALWRLPGDLGRRYAAVSGDVNPIHLTPLTAKAFGFPRTIAHGMWTHARALAALEGRVPSTHTVEVEWRKPVLLPSTVGFSASREGERTVFRVTSKDGTKVHMSGSLT